MLLRKPCSNQRLLGEHPQRRDNVRVLVLREANLLAEPSPVQSTVPHFEFDRSHAED